MDRRSALFLAVFSVFGTACASATSSDPTTPAPAAPAATSTASASTKLPTLGERCIASDVPTYEAMSPRGCAGDLLCVDAVCVQPIVVGFGGACDAYGDGPHVCAGDMFCAGGVCARTVGVNASCDQNTSFCDEDAQLHCDPDQQLCVPPSPPGAWCQGSPFDCADGEYCRFDSANADGAGRCETLIPAGQPCNVWNSLSDGCAAGLHCAVDTMVCEAPEDAGRACFNELTCKSGVCDCADAACDSRVCR